MAAASSTLSRSTNSNPYQFAVLNVGSLAQRKSYNFRMAVTAVLDELYKLGSYRNISIHTWFGESAPSSFHIGDRDHQPEPLISANWFIDDVSVTVQAALLAEPTDLDYLLIDVVSQQAAQLAKSHSLRLANSSLRREIKSLGDQIAHHKLVNRARSLLSAKHGISPDKAHQILLEASESYNKPLLSVAREIVAVLGSPALNPAA